MQSRATPNAMGRDVQNVVNEAQELLKTVHPEGANKLDSIQFAGGDTLTTSQIDSLVQAMSAFAPGEPNGAQAAIDLVAPAARIEIMNPGITLPQS